MLSIPYNVKWLGFFFFGLVGNCKCSVWDRAHGTVNSQSAVKNKRIKVQTSRQLKKVLLKVSSEKNSSSCLSFNSRDASSLRIHIWQLQYKDSKYL